MPVPVNKPLTLERCYATVPSLAPITASIGAPWFGRVVKVGCTIAAAVTTAATITCDVNGTAIPGGVITIPTGGTEGNSFSAIVSQPCNEDDGIGFVISAGAGGGVVNLWAEVKQGG